MYSMSMVTLAHCFLVAFTPGLSSSCYSTSTDAEIMSGRCVTGHPPGLPLPDSTVTGIHGLRLVWLVMRSP
jgi:hypothetical protein